MTAAKVAEFATTPNLKAILRVRVWDDEGKVKDMKTPPFEDYAPMLQRVVDANAQAAK